MLFLFFNENRVIEDPLSQLNGKFHYLFFFKPSLRLGLVSFFGRFVLIGLVGLVLSVWSIGLVGLVW